MIFSPSEIKEILDFNERLIAQAMLHLNPRLKALIDRLWNRFWAGGISNPLSAIEQITYLLFMKQIDKLDLKRQRDAELTGGTFTSRFDGEFILPENQSRAKELRDPKNNKTPKAKKENKAELKKLAIDSQTLRWSHFQEMKPDEMLPHVQQKVFPFIKAPKWGHFVKT